MRKGQAVGLVSGASVYSSILITVNFHLPVAAHIRYLQLSVRFGDGIRPY